MCSFSDGLDRHDWFTVCYKLSFVECEFVYAFSLQYGIVQGADVPWLVFLYVSEHILFQLQQPMWVALREKDKALKGTEVYIFFFVVKIVAGVAVFILGKGYFSPGGFFAIGLVFSTAVYADKCFHHMVFLCFLTRSQSPVQKRTSSPISASLLPAW